ncbi:MAG: 2Fe-2S iron-sulfur cluster binding domain-containing protein [Gammaproteobacteria bacterium]|nr:2Fe-2S iron-sulfur cluster binding domain-containing protein [Gammaproteobacteria bacterium]NIN39637.1 2Fe-2S iron-sulfur cluster binding domain-containing protein [Gammaproteobacteria bacterium]NIO25194.1 2Fe-2S iron-sulfur cluster binding domain-containing protein [Gammaproteobacteria bacterium]NIO65823.1 2Fe-2S iron-sulfur cluster binding domain-containing protein [Gammaproteobacteria bacterium]NIP45738.1 2Fe-2S iron-sulfur cluster binding domain-containing protein [Gammaproteobacteria ba
MSANVRILPSGHEFVVEANESLLQAALRSGLALEFSCTTGTCGECAGRVKEGRVRQIRFHDYVIREADKRRGTVLLCCCSADEDVTIEAREASGPGDIPVQNVRARLYGQETSDKGVAIVHLRVMRGKMLRFLAGQHARLKLPGARPMDVSIASCPCDGVNLEFHFDAHDGGDLSARALAGFTKTDRFDIEGPRGDFTLDEASDRPLVFIASDTAIAPVKSIIEHAINLELAQPIQLRWHTMRPDGHYLHNYFRSLTDALDEFSYVPIAGGVSAESFADMSDASAMDVYAAGRDAFVSAARDLLLARGLPRERLFVDALNCRRPSALKED